MTTPQNVIQSMAHKPVPAPIAHTAIACLAGVCQMPIAMITVTTAPMITACQAGIRMPARSTSSSTIGTSAASVLPSVVCSGSRFCTKDVAETLSMGSRLPVKRASCGLACPLLPPHGISPCALPRIR
jgi:hypothetical protein